MKNFLILFAYTLSLLASAASATAAELYNYEDLGGAVAFKNGRDGNVKILPRDLDITCGHRVVTWRAFRKYLNNSESGKVWLQTAACDRNLIVCVDTRMNQVSADPTFCYVGKWRGSY